MLDGPSNPSEPAPQHRNHPLISPSYAGRLLKPLREGMVLTYLHREQLLASSGTQRGQQHPLGTSRSLNSTSEEVSRAKNHLETAAQHHGPARSRGFARMLLWSLKRQKKAHNPPPNPHIALFSEISSPQSSFSPVPAL